MLTLIVQFSTLICVFTLDRIGRRWTLYWGSAMQGMSMFLCGGFTRLGLNADAAGDIAGAGRYGIAAASMIFIFTFTFGATWLTVPWLYPAEIFPLAVRAKGNAWGVVGWSIGNGWLVGVPTGRGAFLPLTFATHIRFSQTLLLPVCFQHISEKTYYLFGIANALSIPIVWAFYPESNQRTLEEMDFLFAADTPWVWDAEETFARLKAEMPEALKDGRDSDIETMLAHDDGEGKRFEQKIVRG